MNDQTQERSLTEIRKGEHIPVALNELTPFASLDAFRAAWQMASKLSRSQMVPKRFQGQDEGAVMDCLLALDMAHRTRTNPLMVLQNLYIVHGTPAWSGQFVIAMINQSGLFAEPLHFEFVGTKGKDDWGCYAETTSKGGKVIRGPTVDIAMAKAEGWYKNQKWQNMPELMLRYRAGAWFGRTECPELMMGIATKEEVNDNPTEYIDSETGEIVTAQKLTGRRQVDATVERTPAEPQGKTIDMAATLQGPSAKVAVHPTESAQPQAEKAQEEERQEEEQQEEERQEEEGETEIEDPMAGTSAEEQLEARGYYYDTVRKAFFNIHNERWDPDIHGTAKATQGPIINSDGHYRARRGTQVDSGEETAPAATQAAPAAQKAPDPLPDTAKVPEDQPDGWE